MSLLMKSSLHAKAASDFVWSPEIRVRPIWINLNSLKNAWKYG